MFNMYKVFIQLIKSGNTMEAKQFGALSPDDNHQQQNNCLNNNHSIDNLTYRFFLLFFSCSFISCHTFAV